VIILPVALVSTYSHHGGRCISTATQSNPSCFTITAAYSISNKKMKESPEQQETQEGVEVDENDWNARTCIILLKIAFSDILESES
jgi:hypothetical protein